MFTQPFSRRIFQFYGIFLNVDAPLEEFTSMIDFSKIFKFRNNSNCFNFSNSYSCAKNREDIRALPNFIINSSASNFISKIEMFHPRTCDEPLMLPNSNKYVLSF